MDMAQTILSILLGGGILTFVQFLISRHDARHDKNKEVIARIDALDSKVDKIETSLSERDAVLARTHILRFKDELYNGMEHSSEYFEQTLDDAETYRQYCASHPAFANGRTKAAIEYIKSEYTRLFRAHML